MGASSFGAGHSLATAFAFDLALGVDLDFACDAACLPAASARGAATIANNSATVAICRGASLQPNGIRL
jgi:hypothetical protein